MRAPLAIAAEVVGALEAGRPVVALESTIITHGMPYPRNLETARAVEAEVRAAGATPATVAVLEGRIAVGLDDAELARLAVASDVRKLSRADLAVALATGQAGSTTVAATMIAARLAGIEVFATGGVGGVHRGAETTFDISADIEELAQTSITVVASGAKAILDLPKTLEALETRGVAVITMGQDAFPAFWSRESGLASPLRLDDPALVARAHRMRRALGLPGGQLVAVPIPQEAEIPTSLVGPHIDAALAEAASRGIAGKAVTPFLLERIGDATAGKALQANVALVRNNAAMAARIAIALAKSAP